MITTESVLALVGLGLQTIPAIWLVTLELRKGRISSERQQAIDDINYAIAARERAIEEVIAQTKATNAALAEGAPAGTPDRYSLEEAVASYVQQNKDLKRKKEQFKDQVSDAFPELGLLGATILISLGAVESVRKSGVNVASL